jgi:hypothetical protein
MSGSQAEVKISATWGDFDHLKFAVTQNYIFRAVYNFNALQSHQSGLRDD